MNLLPCPFCGNPARRHRYHGDATRFYYGCSSDRCPGNLTFPLDEEPDAARTAWNTRAPVLAADHKGMFVDGPAVLQNPKRHGTAFMLKEMERHLHELARRYYAGDIAAVDEFLQLYCFSEGKRPISSSPSPHVSSS